MANSDYQKELFEFEDRSRKAFPRFEKILPKADFEGKVSITLGLEKIIFVSIAVILALVVVFALGVERGKNVATVVSEEGVPLAAVTQPQPEIQPQLSQKSMASEAAKPEMSQTQMASKAATPVLAGIEADDIKTKPLTIIAVTYRTSDAATQTVNWLKKESYPAYMKQEGQYFLVCIGLYPNMNTAQAAVKKIKHLFKDAYIKTRQ